MSPRFDRLASLYLMSPVMRLRSGSGSAIPVLMYHSISEEDESGTRAYYRTVTSPAVFQAQMECLHQNGYRTCHPAAALAFLDSSAAGVDRTVVITFDDGYRDFYRNAVPAMQKYGFTASVFLPTAYIGDHPVQFKGRDCLTWAEVRELQRCGISFGSHTVSHPQLRTLGREEIARELTESKRTIEDKTGVAVDSFAYPYAFPQADAAFRGMMKELLREAGYRCGVCTIVGRLDRGSDPHFIQRLPVNGADDRALFEAKLAGAYDWVGSMQSAFKRAKGTLARH